MPQITPVQGPLAGYNQAMLDQEAVKQAPIETRLLQAKTGEAELKLQQEQMMLRQLSQFGIQGNTTADRMDWLGELALSSGNPDKAQKYLNTGSQLRSRAAQAEAAVTRATLNRGTAELRNLELQERLLRSAVDQESFDAGNAMYYTMTGKQSPYAGLPFDPELKGTLTNRVLSAKDAVGNQLRQKENDSKDRYRTAREKDLDSIAAHRKWIEDFNSRREDRLAKAGGGKAVTSPTPKEQDEASRLVLQAHPEMRDDLSTLTSATYAIASRAKEIRNQNRALGSSEAIARAFTEAEQAGDFKQIPPKTIMGIEFGKGRTEYQGKGKTPQTAQPLPNSNDSSQLIKGHYYTDSGVTMQWDPDNPEAENGWVSQDSEDDDGDDD